MRPIVSVVIPTRGRPTLVVRAVNTALAQTLAEIEIIVVVDGPDSLTSDALSAIMDPRIKVITLLYPAGGSEARNVGVRRSSGEFIAFLDDDDEWLPSKLSQQLELARKSTSCYPVVTSRVIARYPAIDEIWPVRQMRPNESMGDYLLCRNASIRQGEGFIQSSSLFVPRALMLQVQFESGLPRHQDWDWLVRASVYSGVEFLWVWEPLVIYHIDVAGKSVSSDQSLKASMNWINGIGLVSSRAKAYFYATQIAARCKSPATLWSVVRNTVRYPRALAIAMGLALTPRNLVQSSRRRSILTHA